MYLPAFLHFYPSMTAQEFYDLTHAEFILYYEYMVKAENALLALQQRALLGGL